MNLQRELQLKEVDIGLTAGTLKLIAINSVQGGDEAKVLRSLFRGFLPEVVQLLVKVAIGKSRFWEIEMAR